MKPSNLFCITAAVFALTAGPAIAQPVEVFYDGFEESIGINWDAWSYPFETPPCCGPVMLFNDGSHAYEGDLAARQEQAQPWWYASAHDEPTLSDDPSKDIIVEVWQFEDYNKQAPFPPGHGAYQDHDQVQGWLTVTTDDELDFAAIGVHAHWDSPAPVMDWWTYIAYGTASDGWKLTTVPRAQGWRHLKIVIHPYSGSPDDIEFYVDQNKVGQGARMPALQGCDGMPFTRIGLGANPAHMVEDYISNTYEFFWYDELFVNLDEGRSVCPNRELRYDSDNDGDVDQTDFAVFQRCLTLGTPFDCASECRCMDGDGNDTIDADDYTYFTQCADTSGPGIEAQISCDDGLPAP